MMASVGAAPRGPAGPEGGQVWAAGAWRRGAGNSLTPQGTFGWDAKAAHAHESLRERGRH